MSPGEYEEWGWSVEFDPPATSLIRTTNELLALLIATYHNSHRGPDASHPPAQVSDFLHPPDAGDDSEDEDEVPPDEAEAEAARIFAARDNLRSGLGLPGERRSMPLIPRPHATPMPEGLFALLAGTGEEENADG